MPTIGNFVTEVVKKIKGTNYVNKSTQVGKKTTLFLEKKSQVFWDKHKNKNYKHKNKNLKKLRTFNNNNFGISVFFVK